MKYAETKASAFQNIAEETKIGSSTLTTVDCFNTYLSSPQNVGRVCLKQNTLLIIEILNMTGGCDS